VDEKYNWAQCGRHVGKMVPEISYKNWVYKTLNDKYNWLGVNLVGTFGKENNMRITLDVPLVGIYEDGKNIESDATVRFISEDCGVITLKTPDGKKYRLDHDMLKKAISTISSVNC